MASVILPDWRITKRCEGRIRIGWHTIFFNVDGVKSHGFQENRDQKRRHPAEIDQLWRVLADTATVSVMEAAPDWNGVARSGGGGAFGLQFNDQPH